MSDPQAQKAADPRPCKSFPLARAVKRRVWCVRYGECLNLAVENNWESFMCTSCEAFQPQAFSLDRLRADADCCLALLYTLSRKRASGRHLRGLLNCLGAERHEQEYSLGRYRS